MQLIDTHKGCKTKEVWILKRIRIIEVFRLFPLESVISQLFYRPCQKSVLELSESESKQY